MNFCISFSLSLSVSLSVSCLCLFNLFALLCHFIYIFFDYTRWRILFCSLTLSLTRTLSPSFWILRKCSDSPDSLACATHLASAGYRQCELLVLYLKVDSDNCFRLLLFIILPGKLAVVSV